MSSNNIDLPSIHSLGADILYISPLQKYSELARPFIFLLVFFFFVHVGLWYLTPLVIFGMFVAVVTATHDVVHKTIGLGQKSTDLLLFFLGILILESGHSYFVSHLTHHAKFPEEPDPEGDPARMSFKKAILEGPVFLLKLWSFAYRTRKDMRIWLILEAGISISIVGLGTILYDQYPGILLFCAQVIIGSWVYPLLTVYFPHHDYGNTVFTQTRTLRGKYMPYVFLELTYHLEHHLYPMVPTPNLAILSKRLEPFFKEQKVRFSSERNALLFIFRKIF